MSIFQCKKFSEIRHLLPPDSQAAQSYDYYQSQDHSSYQKELAKQLEIMKNQPEFGDVSWEEIEQSLASAGQYTMADEWVLLAGFEPDATQTGGQTITLQDLNLDNAWHTLDFDKPDSLPGTSDGQPPFVYAIIINGNLKARNIFNDNTDGATGLMVLGNLEAENMMVGGQEIFISGNLYVKGLFWGDYNHGNLVAKGAIAANTFLSTDYRFDQERFSRKDRVEIAHFLQDDQEQYDRGRLAALIQPDCLVHPNNQHHQLYGWKDWLVREKMIERLKEGLPVLL